MYSEIENDMENLKNCLETLKVLPMHYEDINHPSLSF